MANEDERRPSRCANRSSPQPAVALDPILAKRNITGAARRLHVSQPTVGKVLTVKDLQRLRFAAASDSPVDGLGSIGTWHAKVSSASEGVGRSKIPGGVEVWVPFDRTVGVLTQRSPSSAESSNWSPTALKSP